MPVIRRRLHSRFKQAAALFPAGDQSLQAVQNLLFGKFRHHHRNIIRPVLIKIPGAAAGLHPERCRFLKVSQNPVGRPEIDVGNTEGVGQHGSGHHIPRLCRFRRIASGKIVCGKGFHRLTLIVRGFVRQEIVECRRIGSDHVSEIPTPHKSLDAVFPQIIRFQEKIADQRNIRYIGNFMSRPELQLGTALQTPFPGNFHSLHKLFRRTGIGNTVFIHPVILMSQPVLITAPLKVRHIDHIIRQMLHNIVLAAVITPGPVPDDQCRISTDFPDAVTERLQQFSNHFAAGPGTAPGTLHIFPVPVGITMSRIFRSGNDDIPAQPRQSPGQIGHAVTDILPDNFRGGAERPVKRRIRQMGRHTDHLPPDLRVGVPERFIRYRQSPGRLHIKIHFDPVFCRPPDQGIHPFLMQCRQRCQFREFLPPDKIVQLAVDPDPVKPAFGNGRENLIRINAVRRSGFRDCNIGDRGPRPEVTAVIPPDFDHNIICPVSRLH